MKNPALIKDFFVTLMTRSRVASGLLKLLPVFILLGGPVSFAQVGVHTDFPDASSAMEIYATNKGLLIPRVTLTNSLSNPSPVTAPATGLLVFNSGPNQTAGFYYWNGSLWVLIGGGSSPSGDYWSLTGNAGTTVGTNFIGTLDDQDFALYTNESERMRITSAGNVVIGNDVPYHPADLFTVVGKPGLDYTINAYSPYVGVYSESGYAGFQSFGGKYGLRSELDSATGFAVYARNFDAVGYGLVAAGSSQAPSYYGGRSAGISTLGNDGIHAYGKSTTAGIGIMAAGSGLTPATIPDGAGGTFIGYWGIYGRSSNTAGTGTGIIGVGNNLSSSYYLTTGSGGAFTGRDGVFGKSINASGTGVIGLGNNMATPSFLSTGSGGAFAGNDGIYGRGVNATTGIGVIGVGNNGASYPAVAVGCGGSFTGYHGAFGFSTNAGAGTGIVGVGNNLNSATLYASGSGGAFTGTSAGAVGWGTSLTAGIGVIGTGNSMTPSLPAGGSGGAFTGNDGVYAKGVLVAGTGVIGSGNNMVPTVLPTGSGGAFTGVDGLYAKAAFATGNGVIGIGSNASTYIVNASGSGGAFTGYHGSLSVGNNVAGGTGVIGAGNNVGYTTLGTGGGGAFTGTGNGAYGKATGATGTGIIGAGNNVANASTYGTGSGGAFTGTACGVAGYATLAGATSYGVYGIYTGGGSNNGCGVYGYSAPSNGNGYGVQGYGNKYGVLGVQGTAGNSNYGVYATGNLGCTGNKPFAIDHPLDPENKILKHYALESPEILNMYRGNIVLNSEGEATIQLPDYFLSININFSYDLTAVGRSAPGLYIKNEIDNTGKFTIAGGSPDQKVSWVVYAERNDLYMRQDGMREVEITKDEWEKGKYLMPELYNQPPEKGIFYTNISPGIQAISDQKIIEKSAINSKEIIDKSTISTIGFKPAEIKQSDVQLLKEIPEPVEEKIEKDK